MFPAYESNDLVKRRKIAEPEDGEEMEVDEADFSGRYSSFVNNVSKKDEERNKRRRERKERKDREKKERQKEEERQRMMSCHSVKIINFNSDDDDSEIEIPVETIPIKSTKERKKRSKNRRKSGRKPKKEKKKDRRARSFSSSSSSSSASSSASSQSTTSISSSSSSTSVSDESRNRISLAQILSRKDKWSFMSSMDPMVSSTFMMMDVTGDRSNIHYDSLYKNETSKYDYLLNKVLGGTELIEKVFFPTCISKQIIIRYYDDKVKKSWKANPERFWRKKEIKPLTDFVELSKFALSESDLQDQVGNFNPEKCKTVEGDVSLIEATPESRSQMYNTQLSKDAYNIDLWLKFLKTQDEIFLASDSAESRSKSNMERLSDQGLLDRKMAILNKAISINFESVKLKLERLKIGMHMWNEEEWNREIKNMEFKHKNDLKMWEGVLDLLESDTRRFKISSQLSKMSLCLEKLYEVLKGNLFTHQAKPNTELFMASVIRRRIRLLHSCGYTERAIGTAQAVCEFNLCAPSLEDTDLVAKRKLFEIFWDSGVARIGDLNAKGWMNSLEDIRIGIATTDLEQCMEEQEVYKEKEQDFIEKLGSNGVKLSQRAVWMQLERLRSEYQWRPIRDVSFEFDDTERFVNLHDVCNVLYPLSRSIAIQLLFWILEDFGAIISGLDMMHPGNLMHEFGIFPNLGFKLRGFGHFVDRFFELAATYVQEQWDLLLSSQLLTRLNFLKRDESLSEKMCVKRFRDEARTLISKGDNVTNTSLMATYAEQMYQLGEKRPILVLDKYLKHDFWTERACELFVSFLRMAIVRICACDDHAKPKMLSNFIINGMPVGDAPADTREIEKKLNSRISDILQKYGTQTSWQGSAFDHVCTLALLFTYYSADSNRRLFAMQQLYSALYSTDQCHSKPIFMKKYVEFMRDYMMSHCYEPRKVLISTINEAMLNYRTNVLFLKLFIEANAIGIRLINLRRFLERNVEKDDVVNVNNVNVLLAYGAVYLELLRHRMLLEKYEVHSPELHRLRAVLIKSSERVAHRDDNFWRILLSIENSRKDDKRVREAFYRAYTECPWSKALILDYNNVSAGEFEQLVDAIVEKELRLRCQKEEPMLMQQALR